MTPEQRKHVAACDAEISPDRLRELAVAVTDRPSPTGRERPLAEWLVTELRRAGVGAELQPLDDTSANALGRLRGSGDGASLLLYAPIDTLTDGTAADTVPAAAAVLDPHLTPGAAVDGDLVTGLGAGNPKGHAACVLAALEAVARAGVPLRGDLLAGFAARGMPTGTRTAGPRGHGAGCTLLLEQGGHADAAVIAKPGWSVAHEEVGLAWFDVRVRGTHTYVGSRHRLPYRNAVAAAGRVAGALEEWFPAYAEAHTDGLVAPQGVVAGIRGGWERTAALTPAECVLRVDLRLSPRTTPTAAARELAAFLDTLGEDLDAELTVAVPGTSTDPASPVVRSAVAAWEELEGRPHEPVTGTSGATDANVLRMRGIPTARIGMPKVAGITDFGLGMNTVDVAAMETLTRHLVRVAVDLTTRGPQ